MTDETYVVTAATHKKLHGATVPIFESVANAAGSRVCPVP